MDDRRGEKIFIFGASGHAKVVIDIIEREKNYEIAFLADDDPMLKGTNVYGYSVLGGKDELLRQKPSVYSGIVAIGSNSTRMAISSWLSENGFDLVTAVHPSAELARGVSVGAGTVIMAGAVVNSDAHIGNSVIVNTRASIDHDCIIGDGVHLAPGATICGNVRVASNSFVCAGATVAPNLTIGANVIVGAGSTVLCDISDEMKVVGSPARPVGGIG